MFVNGSKEWMGNDAYMFISVRNQLEQHLLSLKYDYFYGGIISKRSIYESYLPMLGSHFSNVFVDFSFKEKAYILSPEYTFRVYDYLNRQGLTHQDNKVFYSQEMMRNESLEDIEDGKTFSFWQIGYEIFGRDDAMLSKESILTLHKCLEMLPVDNVYFRMTDKRIFKALCNQYGIDNYLEISLLLDACNEDSDLFYDQYIEGGGHPAFAEKLKYLMNLSTDGRLTFNILRNLIDDVEAEKAIANLEDIYNSFTKVCESDAIRLVPYIPKTWDAYTTYIFDARLADYDKAIAGGGNLRIDTTKPNSVHSGAGIGVTRIAEYLIAQGKSLGSKNQ